MAIHCEKLSKKLIEKHLLKNAAPAKSSSNDYSI
jgi:hypothetical protein